MWANLKTDLKEFVSTVTDEGTQVLEKIDSKMQEAEEAAAEADQGFEGEAYDEDGTLLNTDFEETGIVASATDEVQRRINESSTFLEIPTEEDFAKFSETFDLESKTEEISKLLQDQENLKTQFESLVPTQVAYDDFWMRFYFNCDEQRIAEEWEQQDREAREARSQALQGSIASVKNFWGGAVQAVSKTLEGTGDEAVPESPFTANTASAPAASLSNTLFGAGGRPPFVMNTAVSEDDDFDPDEEEEEEEEELGWDDEDDEDEDSLEEGDSEEQIEFPNQEVEEMKQKLAQATEERDQLHETVEMQSKVIAELRQTSDRCTSGDSGLTPISDSKDEVEKLRMALFEKNSELAALKASLDDTHDDDSNRYSAKLAAKERELKQMEKKVAEQESEMTEVKAQLEATNKESHELRSKSETFQNELQQLKTQSEKDKALLSEVKTQNTELQARLESSHEVLAHSESKLTAAEEESSLAAHARSEADAAAQATISSLQNRLELLERELSEKTALKEVKHPGSPSSPVSNASSGVKVASSTEVAKEDEGDDEDDDAWGDDW